MVEIEILEAQLGAGEVKFSLGKGVPRGMVWVANPGELLLIRLVKNYVMMGYDGVITSSTRHQGM